MPSVTINTDWRRISDLFVTGMEGGYSPWLHSVCRTSGDQAKRPWYDDEALLASPDFSATAEFDDPEKDNEGDGTGRKLIKSADLIAGLQLMAEKFPRHYADFAAENEDAITGDVFLQCVILGDVIYG